MIYNYIKKGGYPDSNREQTVPHTVTLPLSYTHLNLIYFIIYLKKNFYVLYVGVVRTLNYKYQKFMTYLLVYNI